eukprot:c20005_g1_i1.p1 GENE.c20005_g1_i1~~c20005_g1_i1.p1  ORF type:complete len:179 (-),score=26.05 c20005_g1_i1:148-684(-)
MSCPAVHGECLIEKRGMIVAHLLSLQLASSSIRIVVHATVKHHIAPARTVGNKPRKKCERIGGKHAMVNSFCGFVGKGIVVSDRTASTLSDGVVSGITMVAVVPSFFAANATPCAWLPADEQITPHANCSLFLQKLHTLNAKRGGVFPSQVGHLVVGAAEFEGEDGLQVLALEQNVVA